MSRERAHTLGVGREERTMELSEGEQGLIDLLRAQQADATFRCVIDLRDGVWEIEVSQGRRSVRRAGGSFEEAWNSGAG